MRNLLKTCIGVSCFVLGLACGCSDESGSNVGDDHSDELKCDCSTGAHCTTDEMSECKPEDCPETCANGCNDDGTCKPADCPETCANGCNDDGSCKPADCPDSCPNGCNDDGTCKPASCPESCKNGCNADGTCACPGSCKNGCNADGTCACPSSCKTSCHDNGVCQCDKACPNTCSADGTCPAPSCQFTTVQDPGLHPLPGESKAGKSESVKSGTMTDEYLYDATGYIKIGARRDWGGSIVFFGLASNAASNTIDGNDTGREVQVAIYDGSRLHEGCAYNASCAVKDTACANSISSLGWNPVQGGNRCNIGSGFDAVNNKNGVMEIVTTPLHWNPNWESASCESNGCETSLKNLRSDVQLTQRLRFVRTHVVELFYTVHNLANINHTSHVQEIPTLYAAYGAHGLGNYNRLMNADKTEIKITQGGNDGFFYEPFTSSAPWVTLQNTNLDYGVGILYENGLLNYTGWQKPAVFNNVRSDIQFALPANGTVSARAYLILGSFDKIKEEAEWLMQNLAPFGVLDVPAADASVSGKSVTVSGWALDNKAVKTVVARIDEKTKVNLTYGGARADVCNVWVGYPKCNNVGFSGTIDVSGLDKNCKHLLEIIATDTDGNERTIARRLLTVK